MFTRILAAAVVLPLLPFAAAGEPASPEAGQVKTVIKTAVDDTIAVLKKTKDREERRTQVYAIMDPVVDWALMGKLTLGREHWPQFDAGQQKEFIESFSRVIRDSVFDKIQVYTNETVDFDQATPGDKGKYQLVMHVFSQGQKYKAMFKLYRKADAWKVYDLEIEGISMVRIYSAQYDQFLAKGTPAQLLEKLKSKALAVPDEFKVVAKPKKEGK